MLPIEISSFFFYLSLMLYNCSELLLLLLLDTNKLYSSLVHKTSRLFHIASTVI